MGFLRPRRLLSALVFAALVSTGGRVSAQLPPLTVPKGHLRFDLDGRFDFWDRAYFAGVKQSAAQDFVRDPATGSWLPGLGRAETFLRRATGSNALSLSLGKTSGNLSINVATAGFAAALGVTSRLTVFGRVPIVRVRVLERVVLDSTGATAGFNPADSLFGTPAGLTTTTRFMDSLAIALSTLQAQLTGGIYDTLPAQRTEAQAILARGTALQEDLDSLLLGSNFLPRDGTPAALALNQSIDSIRTRLGALSTPIAFTTSPALATSGLPPSGLEDFATRPDGPIKAAPFEPPILQKLGDIEVGAAFALLNGHPKARGFAVRSVLQGTFRLRTGTLDDPHSLFDLGTGDRQPDVQGDLVTDLMGSWFGVRLAARYVVQLRGPLDRRLTPPDQPIALASTLASVERDPGEIVEGSLQPYVRIARNFSVVGGVRHWRKAEDKYFYAAGQEPILGTTPDVLAQGSRENGTILSFGLSLSHPGMRQDGRPGLPVDATVKGEMVVGSTEGRVPARRSVVFQFRVYGKIF